jgi:hypothetical protein
LSAGADVVLFLEFEWTPSAADVQLRAVIAFGFHIFSLSYLHCEGMVPDLLPVIFEDVA